MKEQPSDCVLASLGQNNRVAHLFHAKTKDGRSGICLAGGHLEAGFPKP